ncbi:ferritin-like domain-containing protein [Lactifluus volemus]|nr:ferritin-like domain-containing protein [Lactifluus volemus]
MLFRYLAVALAPLVVSAVPVRRANVTLDPGTVAVAQFADYLEQLESSFYQQMLSKFKPADFAASGFKDGNLVVNEISNIQSQEATHDQTLQGVIAGSGGALSTCQFDFSNHLTDPAQAVASARTFEQVGVGAYLGALSNINDPSILTAGSSIAGIEGRHQSILNLLSGQSPSAQPLDIPLNPPEVGALVHDVVASGCNLTAQSNNPLTITNTGSITAGTQLQFSSPALNNNTSNLSCQIMNSNTVSVQSASQCVVPQALDGPNLVYITNTSQPLSTNAQVRAGQNGAVVAGPAMIFTTGAPDQIGKNVV